jgi:HEAT repeat protein
MRNEPMSALERIAYFQNRRDEVPNQELARELAQRQAHAGIREIAEGLYHENPNVQSDCIKVLYEIGYLNPELIAEYVDDYLNLMKSRNNRLVWGAMIALSTIAGIKTEAIYEHLGDVQGAMKKGSVITVDSGVKVLAVVAARSEEYRKQIFPYLMKHLRTCRPKDVAQHAEKVLVAVNGENKDEFIEVLEKRLAILRSSEVARVRKVIREAEKR